MKKLWFIGILCLCLGCKTPKYKNCPFEDSETIEANE